LLLRFRLSDAGNPYLSVRIDDPSFSAPIYPSLVETDEKEVFSLPWSRPDPNANQA